MNMIDTLPLLDTHLLSRVFSSSVISELAKNGKSKLLTSLAIESNGDVSKDDQISLSTYLSAIYEQLLATYRNEYVYKNVVANKILLSRHSLNTATMHTEFRVGESKADVLMLNGTSHIYEIKSELDSLERIDRQISDYINFSEYVSVVTAEKHVSKLLLKIPDTVGIIVLTDKGALKQIRNAVSGKEYLSKSMIFDSLQKTEYMNIIKKLTGSVPEVSNANMYTVCKDIFEDYSIKESHNITIKTLKARNMDVRSREFIMAVPECLKAASTAIKLNNKQKSKLLEVLNRKAIDCLY